MQLVCCLCESGRELRAHAELMDISTPQKLQNALEDTPFFLRVGRLDAGPQSEQEHHADDPGSSGREGEASLSWQQQETQHPEGMDTTQLEVTYPEALPAARLLALPPLRPRPIPGETTQAWQPPGCICS